MKLSYHNTRGQIVTYPIVTEFRDAEGRLFFVVGPVPRSAYDATEPYEVVAAAGGGWRHDNHDQDDLMGLHHGRNK